MGRFIVLWSEEFADYKEKLMNIVSCMWWQLALSAFNNWHCLNLAIAIVRRACITGYKTLLLLCHIIQPSVSHHSAFIQPSALIIVSIDSLERSCYSTTIPIKAMTLLELRMVVLMRKKKIRAAHRVSTTRILGQVDPCLATILVDTSMVTQCISGV